MERALTDRERLERLRAAQQNKTKNSMRPRTNLKRGRKTILGGAGSAREENSTQTGRAPEEERDADHVPAAPVLGAAVARRGADCAGPLQRQGEVVELALRLGHGRASGAQA